MQNHSYEVAVKIILQLRVTTARGTVLEGRSDGKTGTSAVEATVTAGGINQIGICSGSMGCLDLRPWITVFALPKE